MKKILSLLFFLTIFFVYSEQKGSEKEKPLQLIINNQQEEKMKLLIGLLNVTPELQKIAEIVQHDLSCPKEKLSGFNSSIQPLETIPTKKKLKQYFNDGFNVIIFISLQNNILEWRVYDTLQATMQQGKRISQQKTPEATAHTIADQLWLLLTGQESIFLTKIAYCQSVKNSKHGLKNIYIQGPQITKKRGIVKGAKVIAPRWNNDQRNPILVYSEVTPLNIRLMSVTLYGKRRIISNFDGLTMLANFSQDGKKVVYCASYKGTSHIYYYYYDGMAKKGITKRLTQNQGNNTSPNLRENGDIIFCSDFETKSPQLYYLTTATGDIKRITPGGYCASPHFSEKNGLVAYSKLIGNDMQIFFYNVIKKEHIQITFDKGNKDECSWSPCGNYLTFVYQDGNKSRIAILNRLTHERYFLTDEQVFCSYPSWSPKYAPFGIFA